VPMAAVMAGMGLLSLVTHRLLVAGRG